MVQCGEPRQENRRPDEYTLLSAHRRASQHRDGTTVTTNATRYTGAFGHRQRHRAQTHAGCRARGGVSRLARPIGYANMGGFLSALLMLSKALGTERRTLRLLALERVAELAMLVSWDARRDVRIL